MSLAALWPIPIVEQALFETIESANSELWREEAAKITKKILKNCLLAIFSITGFINAPSKRP